MAVKADARRNPMINRDLAREIPRNEREQIEGRIGTLKQVHGNMVAVEASIKAIAQADPDADEAWADDALKGLADVISDMAWNLKNMEDKVAEPAPHESLEQTGRG